MPAAFSVVPGTTPLVLVAPHGGRRDPVRRAWTDGGLKVNDLHTGTLAAALAACSGGAALLNTSADRNDVDLNRIGEAHDRAPEFLARLLALLDAALARHARVTLLTVHGWNVVQPALDLGLGCAPGAPLARAAVSPGFAADALPRLVGACAAHGVAATVGARYPARNRENLLQLFTPRHRDDPRPMVRALAALAPRVEAMQLELGIPLRWPGPWRARLLEAFRAALPALLAPPGERAAATAPPPAPLPTASGRRLEFASGALSGLVAVDAGRGGRLLLFPPGGGLVLFTGERTGGEHPGRVGPLAMTTTPDGLAVRFRGPLLRFPDTLPFLDLERGLAGAWLVDAEVTLDVTREAALGDPFGRVAGTVVLDGVRTEVAAPAFTDADRAPGPWPRLCARLRLGDDAGLAVTVGLDGGAATGIVVRDGRPLPVTAARAVLGPPESPLARVTLDVALASGDRLTVTAHAAHRLPVVRGHGPAALRLEFAACRLEGTAAPVGWCEVGGL